MYPMTPNQGHVSGRAILTHSTVQIPDTNTDEDYRGLGAKQSGFRSLLATPLLRGDRAIGSIVIYKAKPGTFTARQLDLLQNFAAQAVIAIENARLFDEVQSKTRDLQESLQQQTATADVLKVISRSAFDLQTVLDTLVQSATQLCEADHAWLLQREGDFFLFKSSFGYDTATHERIKKLFQRRSAPINRGSIAGRSALGACVVHVADVLADPDYKFMEAQEIGGYRAALGAPLLRDGKVVGVIFVARTRPEPYSAKQIELVTTFADQAVIAIENARLFNEVQERTRDLSESLKQQTATADVLKVISRSAFDLQAVLNTLVESAVTLSGAQIGTIFQRRGELFYLTAAYNFPGAVEYGRANPVAPGLGTNVGRTAMTGTVMQMPDVLADPDFTAHGYQQLGNFRALLGIPLKRDGKVEGVFSLCKRDPGLFEPRHVELVQTFADQAVIAIENARLFNETKEALERQTATADILKVIASSPSDVQPVFEAIAASANRLIGGYSTAVFRFIDGVQHLKAFTPTTPEADEILKNTFPMPLDNVPSSSKILNGETSQLEDTETGEEFQVRLGRARGFRSIMFTPLMHQGTAIGVITITRREPGRFADHHVQLLRTFADQAVIAIENTRLFNEVQERTRDLSESLQQQTATAEVLQIISSSPGNLSPVFDKMLENATRVCGAEFGSMVLIEGDTFRRAGLYNAPAAFADAQRAGAAFQIHPQSTMAAAIRSRQIVQIDDLRNSPAYLERSQASVDLAELAGARTIVVVPMLREDEVIGLITVYRQEVRLFGDKQIELLTNFARQAVIAIENARLLPELRQRTDDLSEALVYQTGSSNILKVIASSPTDIEPVLNAIVEGACELCEANDAAVLLKDGEHLRFRAHHGPIDINLEKFPITRGWTAGRAFLDGKPVHLRDTQSEEAKEFPDSRMLAIPPYTNFNVRTVLSVPLLRESERVGVILLRRIEMRPFSDKQIALLQTFADQAVIAINNAQLFDEVQAKTRDLEESLQQQTATADVLKVISRSAFDLQTVLDTLVESAARLCNADEGAIFQSKENTFRLMANWGLSPALRRFFESHSFRPGRETTVGRVLLGGKTVHIHDTLSDPDYGLAGVDPPPARTTLGVPLLRERSPIGVVVLTHREVRPFTDRQIELVQTFADQAVIAIENARLFDEVQARTRELTKSLEELRTTQDRLVQTQKLALLGQLTAGIAHEIKNPLNFVNNFSGISAELIDELRDTLKGVSLDDKARAEIEELADTLKGNFDKVVHHGRRADAIVKNMLQHSREGSGEHRVIDINALVEESLNLAWHGARAETQGFEIKLKQSFDPSAGGADVFPQDIRRALLNLIANGFYATKRRGQALRLRADSDGLDQKPWRSCGDQDSR